MTLFSPITTLRLRARLRRTALLLAELEPHRLADIGLTRPELDELVGRAGGRPQPRTMRPY